MKAAVIGGTGFLGSHLVQKLVKKGIETIVISRNPAQHVPKGANWVKADRNQTPELITALESKPEVIFDCALFSSIQAEKLLAAISQVDCRYRPLVVATGTIAEYGLDRKFLSPIAEREPLSPSCSYGIGKVKAYYVLKEAAIQERIRFIWAVLPQLWGPRDNSGRDAYWIYCIKTQSPILLRGQGKTILPDGYVETAAEAMIHLALTRQLLNQRVNIAGPTTTTPLEFIQISGLALGITPRIIPLSPSKFQNLEASTGFRYTPVFGDYDFRLQTTLLYNTGFIPSTNCHDGIAKTALWHSKNNSWFREELRVPARITAIAQELCTQRRRR